MKQSSLPRLHRGFLTLRDNQHPRHGMVANPDPGVSSNSIIQFPISNPTGDAMKWGFFAKAMMIAMAILVLTTNAFAAVTVVYPTGQWPDDVDNVQTAVNSGGRVLLKAVNVAGAPTAFNFGTPEYLAHRRVILDTAVELLGEQRGVARTTIRGGLAPVRGYAQVRRTIRNIDFDGNLLRAIGIRGSADRLEVSGVRIRHVIPLPAYSTGFPFSEAEGIFISGYGSTNVSGAIALTDNLIDMSDVEADLQWSVQLDNAHSDITISGSTISIGQAPGNASDSEAIALVRCHGLVVVKNNVVNIGQNAYVGINGYGGPDATFRISENVIRNAGPYADAIDIIGVSSGGGANGGVAHGRISENLLFLQDAYSGIALLGLVSGVRVSDNTLIGTAIYGIVGASYAVPTDQVTDNQIADNEVRRFKAGSADVFLDTNTSSNTVRDSCRSVIDLGTGNVVRCGQ